MSIIGQATVDSTNPYSQGYQTKFLLKAIGSPTNRLSDPLAKDKMPKKSEAPKETNTKDQMGL
ncbi:hypothetical protein JCM5176_04950 [Streptococcus sobrinus]